MNRFTAYFYAITVVVVASLIWVMFFVNVTIDPQAIPTLVNGITSSTSVIVGFCGVTIGMMFREVDKENHKAKTFYFGATFLLLIPLSMLWTTYTYLTTNLSQLAVRNGLGGLIMALYIFISVIIYSVKSLSVETPKLD
jgi:hypothetical protein